ncbi:MAG: hypothetical protein IRZ32_06030 [Solirubrobacteraceae bacterium]|nr:hypothetical protein [Solirubrobacteraceae bacterium]
MIRCSAGILLGVLALAAPASAAPFTAGTGHDAQVAVGPDGTGHVTWLTDVGGDGRVAYCRVPAGGEACERTEVLAFPTAGGNAQSVHSTPQVFVPSDERVVLVASCWNCGAGGITNRTFQWTSTDGGASFGPPVERARGLIADGQGALLPETDTLLIVGGGKLQAIGDAPLGTPEITLSTTPVIESPAVAPVPGTDQVVHVSGDLDRLEHALYAGPQSAAAMDVEGNWLRGQPVPGGAPGARGASLAAGPGGLRLAFRVGGGGNTIRVSAWDPAARAFGTPRDVVRGGGADEPDLAQDPGGALALVWRIDAFGRRLRYARAATADGPFSPAALLARGEAFIDPQVAAGPGGSGFAVWGGLSGEVRVTALPPAVSAAYRGAMRTIRARDARLRYRLRIPRGCVHPGQSFTAALGWSRRHSGVTARVHRVTFRMGSQTRVDTASPFRQTLTVPADAAPASRLTVRARASVRDGGRPVSGRALTGVVTVCDA